MNSLRGKVATDHESPWLPPSRKIWLELAPKTKPTCPCQDELPLPGRVAPLLRGDGAERRLLQSDAPGLVEARRETAQGLVAGPLQHGADRRCAPRERILLDAAEVSGGEELHDARVIARARVLAHAEFALGQHQPARFLGHLASFTDVVLRQGGLRLRPSDAVGHQPSRMLKRGHSGDGARSGIAVRPTESEVVIQSVFRTPISALRV